MNILLVEDNEDDALFVQVCLAECLEGANPVQWVVTLEEGLKILRGDTGKRPDVVLLDLGLPDSQGMDTLNAVLQARPEVPVVVLTGMEDRAMGLQAVQRGAQDFLPKQAVNRNWTGQAIRFAVERKAAQRELAASEDRYRRLSAELEREVEKRTDALVEAHQDMIHFARVSLLGEMTAGIAHELRQPLTTIQCNAEAGLDLLAASGVVDVAELREILQEVIEENRRASAVIEKLRKLYRKDPVKSTRIQLNQVIQEVLALLRQTLVANGTRSELELAPDLQEIEGDRIQLDQVVSNLVLNAVDAMKASPVDVRQVRICSRQPEAGWVELTVADRGEGIAEDSLPRLFDSFFTTKPDGMGMGLSICQTIVDSHGGKIWAANRPEGGACFHVRLPVAGSLRVVVPGD